MNGMVSIITPCYNAGKYIERYLNFIIRQSYEKIELIIVNDGSTDNTEEIINSYIKELNGKKIILKYIKQENKGLGGAVNTGLKLISGEYFTWCDADNFYTDDYVKTTVEFFEANPQYAVVRCDGYIVMDRDIHSPVQKLADGNKNKYKEDLFENAIEVKDFHFGCAMVKTSCFDMVNPQREIYESREGQNWQILLPVFYYYKSGYIDKPMFYFVFREDSVSNRTAKMPIEKKYAQLNEYKKILTETIHSIHMYEDKRKYFDMVDVKFLKLEIIAQSNYKNYEKAKYLYKKLKKSSVLSTKERIFYNIYDSRIWNKIFKIYKKFQAIVKHKKIKWILLNEALHIKKKV